MSTAAVIGRNILSNWSGFLFQVLVAFLLTPFVVNKLGNTYYGMWSLIVGLTGYYGLLDLGFSAGLTQYVSRYYARKELGLLNETISTGWLALAISAILVVLVTATLASTAERLFVIPPHAADELRWSILIVGIGAALQFLFFPYSAVFPATQRFDISNAIGICTRILFAASVYVALERGYGLIGASVATTATTLIDYSIRALIAYRLIPGLRLSPGLANLARLRELASFGIWNVAIAGSLRLIFYSSSVIIAIFLPPAAVTPFALASNLTDYFMRLFVPIGQVFFPVFTSHDATGANARIRSLFLDGTRLLSLLALPAGLLAYWLADDFFALWIGQPAKSADFPSAASIFRILIIASVAGATQRITYQVLMGTRRNQALATCLLIEGVANLVLAVILIGPLGLAGVAVAVVVPALAIEGFAFPYLVCRLYGIKAREYLVRVLARAAMITIMLWPALVVMTRVKKPDTWAALAFEGALGAAMIGILILALGMSGEERRRFVWAPLAAITRKLRRTQA
jgi:O-antigen/teichoic acid export membrane protein